MHSMAPLNDYNLNSSDDGLLQSDSKSVLSLTVCLPALHVSILLTVENICKNFR